MLDSGPSLLTKHFAAENFVQRCKCFAVSRDPYVRCYLPGATEHVSDSYVESHTVTDATIGGVGSLHLGVYTDSPSVSPSQNI